MTKEQINFISSFTSVESADNIFCSTFSIALRDARLITGREIKTGKSMHNILSNSKGEHLKPYSPIGLLSYLIILEMIGKIFQKTGNKIEDCGIISALRDFSKLNEREIYTIKALRNALGHSYSLTNIPFDKKHYENSLHLFAFHISGNVPLIQYPNPIWDGNYNKTESRTWIQINELFNIVDLIIQFIADNLENKEIKLKMDINEIKTKYFINYG
jgi:hypothetical protein